MARITLILSVIAGVVYLLDGFRFVVNEWRRWRNRARWLSVLLISGLLFFYLANTVQATDYYINADCGNNGDGSSWSCAGAPAGAGAFNVLPADASCGFAGYTWVRGGTYWLGGSDTIYTGGACFRNHSGTGRITLKKASVADHGTETGWAESYGTKQAVTATMVLWASDITIDGAYRATPESGYGIKTQSTSGNNLIDTKNNIPTTGNILKYLELTHTTYTASAGHAVNLWGDGGNTLQYLYGHDLSGLCFKGNLDGGFNTASGFEDTVIEESVCGDIGLTTGASHFELIKDDGQANGTIIRNSFFYNWGGSTGGIVLSDGQTNWEIYNNVFVERNETRNCGNGVITGLTAGSGWTGIHVYNNTFANITISCANLFGGGFGDFSGAGNQVKNNVFYNTEVTEICGGGCTKAKNWFYLNSGYTLTGDDLAGSANPFTNDTLEDFTLVALAGPIDVGENLSGTFTTDKNGVVRPQGSAWDIGAYEFSYEAPAAGTPVIVVRVLRWMEVAAFVTGVGWHLRKPIFALLLVCVSWTHLCVQFAPKSYDMVKLASRESAIKVLTGFNYLTKTKG